MHNGKGHAQVEKRPYNFKTVNQNSHPKYVFNNQVLLPLEHIKGSIRTLPRALEHPHSCVLLSFMTVRFLVVCVAAVLG